VQVQIGLGMRWSSTNQISNGPSSTTDTVARKAGDHHLCARIVAASFASTLKGPDRQATRILATFSPLLARRLLHVLDSSLDFINHHGQKRLSLRPALPNLCTRLVFFGVQTSLLRCSPSTTQQCSEVWLLHAVCIGSKDLQCSSQPQFLEPVSHISHVLISTSATMDHSHVVACQPRETSSPCAYEYVRLLRLV
jgi:hypothetical protein